MLLQGLVGKLKDKLNIQRNESKACIALAHRISDDSDEQIQSLFETKAKLTQLSKQKENLEKGYRHEISRLKLENQKLLDRLRNKTGT